MQTVGVAKCDGKDAREEMFVSQGVSSAVDDVTVEV